jgi:S-adenosylmethionine synthetase
MVDTYGTGKHRDRQIAEAVNKVFDFRPAAMIAQLDLKRPIYRKTAAYGHFGREEEGFTWEKADRVEELKAAMGPKTKK